MSGPARRILEDLRRARALVVHPRDEEGASLVDQLRRLGCEVSMAWPPPAALPPDIDTLFIQLDDAEVGHLLPSIEETEPAVIAIVAYESPTSLKAIVDFNAHGVLSKPLRPRGVLTQFALARYRRGYEGRLAAKIVKLEDTMKGRRMVEKAVRLLTDLNRIDEDAAYKLLRDRATAARVPLASVAESVVAAHEAMSGLGLHISLAERS
ncbi:AmiR/NasT family two-component response regulator [Methylopila capsulata]|uniref:AmiR/NasT family two-component response regulator n=1 Tax=Methylopila capsulata TaxID=61654 RepID=A0A9W6IXF3_9HYPH|nr:ANTAR domain-containing protein [Methylopila capsulata]MBM7852663.1 AmiR/NasT family two-component response regulator [Methylopila capsulata]GLK56871.1 transcription antitermination regulator [Methylopila capsulata]